MNRVKARLYLALGGVAAIIVVHLTFFVQELMGDPTDCIRFVILLFVIPHVSMLLLLFLTLKGFVWAYRLLGSLSAVAVLLMCFMPVCQHAVDRTPAFYSFWATATIIFGFAAYGLLLDRGIREYVHTLRPIRR